MTSSRTTRTLNTMQNLNNLITTLYGMRARAYANDMIELFYVLLALI